MVQYTMCNKEKKILNRDQHVPQPTRCKAPYPTNEKQDLMAEPQSKQAFLPSPKIDYQKCLQIVQYIKFRYCSQLVLMHKSTLQQ